MCIRDRVQPDLVLNLGSAGTVNHQVGDIFVCRKFIDRDMQKLAGLGLECEIDSSALLETKGFCKHWTEEGICNTGDGFLKMCIRDSLMRYLLAVL